MVYYLESKYEKPWAVDNQCNYTVEEITEGLEWINSLEEHHVLPSIEYLKGQGVDTIEKNPDWACGKYAGFFEWDSAQQKFADGLQEGQEFVLGDYITGFGKKVAGMYKISQAWTIAESSQHKKEAALLINFLVSDPEAVKILGVERGVVVNKAAEKILEEDGQLKGLTYEGNKLAMANANYPLDPNFENSSLKDTTGSYYTTMESLSYGDDPAELSFYLLALARTAAEIDEEVFDHKMNLVMQYRKVLKKNLSAFEGWDPDSVKRVKESIRLACENRMLLREKYEDYIGEM